MSIAVIGGKLYINKPKNMNHVHKSSKDLVFVMINLGKKYKWRGHIVLWQSKTERLWKKSSCTKTHTQQNNYGYN